MNFEVVVKNKQGQTIDDMYQKGYYIFKFTAILTTPILRQEFGEKFHKGGKDINATVYCKLLNFNGDMHGYEQDMILVFPNITT